MLNELSIHRCRKSGKEGKGTGMAELGPAGQTGEQKENAQAVETGTGTMGRL